MHIWVYLYLCLCPSVHPSIHPIHPPISLFIHPPVHPSIFPSIHPICPSLPPYLFMSINTLSLLLSVRVWTQRQVCINSLPPPACLHGARLQRVARGWGAPSPVPRKRLPCPEPPSLPSPSSGAGREGGGAQQTLPTISEKQACPLPSRGLVVSSGAFSVEEGASHNGKFVNQGIHVLFLKLPRGEEWANPHRVQTGREDLRPPGRRLPGLQLPATGTRMETPELETGAGCLLRHNFGWELHRTATRGFWPTLQGGFKTKEKRRKLPGSLPCWEAHRPGGLYRGSSTCDCLTTV